MPVPNIYQDTAATHGTGALSVPWGTHNNTFAAILVVTCAGDGVLGTPTQSGSDGTWTLIASCAEGSGAGSIQIAAYWCRATSSSMSNVTVPDTGDHTSAKMFMMQNVVSSGNPINMFATQTIGTATASISMAVPNTTVPNCRVFMLAGCGFDQNTNPGGSGWSNASLTDLGLAGQYCTDLGTGGGYLGGSGSKTVAGPCGTFTHSWASGATKQANIIFAISDTATTGGSAASSTATSTAAGVGGAIGAGAGASAGAAAASATASSGTYGESLGIATATSIGSATAISTGSASGAGAATASSTEHLLIHVTATPQTIPNGAWSVSAFEAKWKTVVTMTFASGNAAYTGYHGVITSGIASGYGLWLNGSNFEVVDADDNILGTFACTWSAGQSITLMPNFVGGVLTISGATTGNNNHTFTPSAPHWVSGSALYIGGWGGSPTWTLAATFGDIYAVVTPATATASGSSTAAATGGSASATTGAGSAAGISNASAVSSNESVTTGVGTAASNATATAVSAQSNPDFELGAVVSARLLYGASQTSVTTAAVNTQASGSTIIICTGGRLTDLTSGPTDNKGNTYAALGIAEEFADWPNYGIRMWQCIGATGGSNHTFTQTQTAFEEVSIVAVEITGASWIEDSAIVERANAASLTSPNVTALAEAHWLIFWSGDAPTGATMNITPNNGQTVIDSATAIDHPNGYVPLIATHAYKSIAGTYSSTAGITPIQGAIIGAVVVQRAHIASGPASSAGTSNAIATSSAIAAATGASASIGSTTAAGAAQIDAIGNITSTSGATAIGQVVQAGTGSSNGLGSPAAIGAAITRGAAFANGTASIASIGGARATGDGVTAGSATATATGIATAVGIGVASGNSIVASTAPGISSSVGSADSTVQATAVGTAVTLTTGTSTSAGTSTAVGLAVTVAAAASSGSTNVTATGNAVARGAGTANATCSTAAIAAEDGAGTGLAIGICYVLGLGAALSTATGASAGMSAAVAQREGLPITKITRLHGTGRHYKKLKGIIPQ